MYSCHCILECYNLFSGVKLCIRSFFFYFETTFTRCLRGEFKFGQSLTGTQNVPKFKFAYKLPKN